MAITSQRIGQPVSAIGCRQGVVKDLTGIDAYKMRYRTISTMITDSRVSHLEIECKSPSFSSTRTVGLPGTHLSLECERTLRKIDELVQEATVYL